MRILFFAALLLVFSNCSSPSSREQYIALDGENKSYLIAAYPDLTPEQRAKILTSENEARSILEKIADEDPQFKKLFWMYKEHPEAHQIKSLEIKYDESLLRSPTVQKIPFQAFLHYFDQRVLEVTSDVQWQVLPTLGVMKQSQLSIGCVDSDIVVSARFLDAIDAQITLPIRKKIARFNIQFDHSTEGHDTFGIMGFRSYATCTDGTQSDVTCQSTWSLKAADSSRGEFLGCGRLRFSGANSRADTLRIMSQYGGAMDTQDFQKKLAR